MDAEREEPQRVAAGEPAEAAAIGSEDRFRNIIENMQEFVVVTDGSGVVTVVNPSTVRLLGYADQDEILGKDIADTVCDSPEECSRVRNKLALSGTLSRELVLFKRRDGSRVVVEGNFRLVSDQGGNPIRLECVGRDITDRQGVEDELRRAKEEAEAATKAKSEFLANMSHELRTPLNAIVGLAHLLEQTELGERQRELLGKLQASATGLIALIGDLLDFSKIEAGKLEIETAEFEVEEVLGHVASTLASRARDKGVGISVRIEPGVPRRVVGDALRLGQVLLNLVGNAVKLTDGGQVTVGVELADRAGSTAHLRFMVRDTGAGIWEAQQGRLFEPFVPVDGANSRRQSGTGLGLAITKQLVALMGGSLALENEPGRGSTFSFAVKVGLPPNATLGKGPPVGTKLRVLVVDDSLTGREVLRAYLGSMAHDVHAVASGTEALEELQAAAAPYDLVLLDWYMEDTDGPEVARRIKSNASLKRVPRIVMVTGNDEDGALEEARALGVDGFVSKPIDETTLRTRIESIFGATPGELELPANDDPREKAPTCCRGRLAGRRILVVEDNDINREVARGMLEGAGIEVVLAEDGRQALEILARDDRVDAILMDLRMPVMDGLVATRAIRSRAGTATLPIIALTAEALATQRDRCFEAGMDEFLTKPIAPDRLFEVLERMLAHRPSRPAARVAAGPSAPPPKPAAAGLTDALPGLDTRAALRRLMGNRDLYAKLLRAFAGEHQEDVARIREALERGDTATARAMAHKLKGVAGNLSATQVFAVASRVEALLRESPLAPVGSQLDELAASIRTVTESIATLPVPVPKAASAVPQ